MGEKSQEKPQIKRNVKRRKYTLAVGQLLDRSVSKAAYKRGFAEVELLAAWRTICPEYAQYSYPLKLRGDKLQVAVNSASAAHNMKMWELTLLQNLHAFFGYEAIKKVTYIQKSFKVIKPEKRTVLQVNNKAQRKAEKKCAFVKDTALRDALVRLGALVYTDNET